MADLDPTTCPACGAQTRDPLRDPQWLAWCERCGALIGTRGRHLRAKAEAWGQPPAEPPLRVVAAAVQAHGLTFSLPPPARHHNVLRLMHDLGLPDGPSWITGQGFLLSDGRWASRRDAWLVAVATGQLLDRAGRGPDLFSEDVW